MNWKQEEWGNILEIKNGRSQKKVIDENGKFPIYGSGGLMGYANDYLCEPGTTIIGRKGSINKPIYVSTKFWNVDTAFGLCPGENLDNRFFYYFCLTYNFLKHNKATTLPSLTKTDLLKIKIPLPPLPIQKKIAAILDAADLYRQKTKALIEKYDELTQSLFLEMFGDTHTNSKRWVEYNLEDICLEIVDCPHSTPKYVDYKSEFPCIRTTELKNGNIEWGTMKFLDYDGYIQRTRRLIPKPGDVVYGREGSFGEAAIIPVDIRMSLGQRVMLFRPKFEIISSIAFWSILRSPGLYRQALRRTSGSTVGHVNIKDIRKFRFPVPDLSTQHQFESRYIQIKDQIEFAKDSLNKAEELFQSLLQRAFKGELNG